MNPSESAASRPRLFQSTTPLEMRCCCNPNVVLGMIQADPGMIYQGNAITFTVEIPARYFRARLSRVLQIFSDEFAFRRGDDFERHVRKAIAIKSDDVPAYVLPYIVGFEIFAGRPPELERPAEISPWDWESHCDRIYQHSRDALLARSVAKRGPPEAQREQEERAIAWLSSHGQFH